MKCKDAIKAALIGSMKYGWIVALMAVTSAQATVVDALRQAGFSCAAAKNSSGVEFGGQLCVKASSTATATFSYDEPISVFIPSQTPALVDHIVLYLQGFRGVCGDTGTPDQLMNFFSLGEQMEADASAGAILVYPESIGNDETYYDEFTAKAGPFAAFLTWIEGFAGTSKWSIAGHSGAGDIIARSLTLNPSVITKFDSVDLLDAAYSMTTSAEIPRWQLIEKVNPALVVTCIGNGTYSGCQTLAADVKFKTPVVVTRTTTAHCDIPGKYLGPWLKSGGSQLTDQN